MLKQVVHLIATGLYQLNIRRCLYVSIHRRSTARIHTKWLCAECHSACAEVEIYHSI